MNTNVSLRKEDKLLGNHLSEIAAAISKNIENLIYSSSEETISKYKNLNETFYSVLEEVEGLRNQNYFRCLAFPQSLVK